MVILASNEPVQSSDYTSGLERRRLTVPFIHQVKANERRDLDAEFKPYLPALLQWVLAIPDDQVTALVRIPPTQYRHLLSGKQNLCSKLTRWQSGLISVLFTTLRLRPISG